MLKKFLTFTLTTTLLVSSLTGCTGKSIFTFNNKNTQTKFNEKPIDLIWWTIGAEPKDYALVSEEIRKYTLEKLNVNLQIKYSDWGEYGEKLSDMVKTGEPYDILFTSGIGNYQDLLNNGYFMDLTELLPNVTPDLYNFIPEDLWQGVTINNKILGIPAYKDSSQSQYWIWDKQLVQEFGIDYQNIETLQDLEPVLKQIKDANPNEYPLVLNSTDGINGFMTTICNYDEILVEPTIGINFNDPSAKVVGLWEQPDVLENLRILHSWYNKGYINPDAATLIQIPDDRKLSSAQSFEGGWKDTEVGHKYFGPVYSTRTIQGSFLSLSAGCTSPEEALKVIELVNTDKYFRNLLAFGIEGTHYEKTGENTIKKLNDKYEVPAYSQGTFFNMYVQEPNPANQWDELKQVQASAVSSPILGFVFNNTKVQSYILACEKIEEKYRASLMTGTANPDEVLPKMIAELNAAGYQNIIAEAQNQVDKFLYKK